MAKLVTYADFMKALAERTVDNSRQLKRGIQQRRNGMEDLYGVCFSAQAMEEKGRYNARFYISLSPDYIYLHRFAFKFVIMPSIVEDEDPSEGRDWKVTIGRRADGTAVDITPYLKEQQDLDPSDPLFKGEGVYPTNRFETREDFYDILDVISVMVAEGEDENARTLTSPLFKPVVISSTKPFSVDAYLYLKYSAVNR